MTDTEAAGLTAAGPTSEPDDASFSTASAPPSPTTVPRFPVRATIAPEAQAHLTSAPLANAVAPATPSVPPQPFGSSQQNHHHHRRLASRELQKLKSGFHTPKHSPETSDDTFGSFQWPQGPPKNGIADPNSPPDSPALMQDIAPSTDIHHSHHPNPSGGTSGLDTTPSQATVAEPNHNTCTLPLAAADPQSRQLPQQKQSPRNLSSGTQQESDRTKPVSNSDTLAQPDANINDNPSTQSDQSLARLTRSGITDLTTASENALPDQSQRRQLAQITTQTPSSFPEGRGGQTTPPTTATTQVSPEGHRELLLVKSLAQSSPPDDKRSSHRAPPVSYKPPLTSPITSSGPSTPIRVPPIRAFRSSGSRKSLVLDMNVKARPEESGDEVQGDPQAREYALNSLEGRSSDDAQSSTPSAHTRIKSAETEDTSDMFLEIAREDSLRRKGEEEQRAENYQTTIRPFRASHRRPLSTNVASYQPTSPPRVGRRMSDHEENARRRWEERDQNEPSRNFLQRPYIRDKAFSAHPGEDATRTWTGNSTRASPATPRQDHGGEAGTAFRRRPSVGDTNPPLSRSSMYKPPAERHHHPKVYYNSSPLARTFDSSVHAALDQSAPVEGTESTASTTAPSTVWDELDDLKSRIHRLELTGKLPSTSAAAVSRASDDRPPTANTTATTAMSMSPKKTTAHAQDAASTTSSQRENHPILVSALSKSKPFLKEEVWQALEAVANDAIGLSAMMGLAGQPGPIASGASSMGVAGAVTDRQLRRKADSVCRSLTELCLALGEDVASSRQPAHRSRSNSVNRHEPTTPTMIRPTQSGLPGSRRQSVAAESEAVPGIPSPRTLSKFEERRNTILSSSALPSPPSQSINSNPGTPRDVNHVRRSSLLVNRTRRAGTDEPEEGRRSSLMMRSRRAGTEEPEEGRRTSLLIRNRRGTLGEGEEESRFRAPSRAITEVHSSNPASRESAMHNTTRDADNNHQQAATALPRRRFASSSVQSPRQIPSATLQSPSQRRLDSSSEVTPNRALRHTSLSMGPSPSSSAALGRSSTFTTRRNRDSGILPPSISAPSGVHR